MIRRRFAIVIVVGALALGGASIAWAVNTAQNGSWTGHHYSYGPAMMGLGYSTGKANPVSGMAEARQRAQSFADRLGLKTDEVLHFQRNYYVKLVDKQGANATEVLVDPETGAVSLEYGPAMMWNTKYGMMSGKLGSGMMSADAMRSMMGSYGGSYSGMMGGGMMGGAASAGGMMGGSTGGMMGGGSYRGGSYRGGMMGGGYTAPSAPANAHLSLERVHELAQQWLDANQSGTKVESGGDSFPGYYTLETLRGGKISGMISVNATTGAVWPHWWHGQFVERAE